MYSIIKFQLSSDRKEPMKGKKLSTFLSMEKEYVMQVASTARKQLLASINISVIWSWGTTNFTATVHNGMPSLKFSVNGRLHKGFVIISLDEGIDYYEVHLQDATGTRLVKDEVCFDELGSVIDEAIESGTNKAEYKQFCDEQRKKICDFF